VLMPMFFAFFYAIALRMHVANRENITEFGGCFGEFCCGFWCWYCSIAQCTFVCFPCFPLPVGAYSRPALLDWPYERRCEYLKALKYKLSLITYPLHYSHRNVMPVQWRVICTGTPRCWTATATRTGPITTPRCSRCRRERGERSARGTGSMKRGCIKLRK
jgi:hypothetical protein